ncbi:ABC transporter ATP-binding protein [Thalassospira profundimaris]|uniref:ABC transporter ATP-binding protein n=1 Tax=Thalassospira profundimaris TaxID=502049 RepID=A0A367XCD7_9PROT|nr:ABC transporter ATP-binding protein [Thalassospira profundimaris]RCK51237.1 ABC transporter ATP-binding protein [Thalassospira profundimaris]
MTDILRIRDLEVEFVTPHMRTKAVDKVSFRIGAQQTVALVGESGSGKTTISQAIMGILPRAAQITGGSIVFADPKKPGTRVDIAMLSANSPEMRAIRGGSISMIFQEPMSSLSPIHTVGDQITEAVRLHQNVEASEARDLAREMLELVGFPNAKSALRTYPFELSGGLRQRAMIAMALVCRPALLVADEPTTALDVTIQAQTLRLIKDLQKSLKMSVLLITHDLGVVANMADHTVVVYNGRVVERGRTDDIFINPGHAYTRSLLQAVPHFDMGPDERLKPLREIKPRTDGLLTLTDKFDRKMARLTDHATYGNGRGEQNNEASASREKGEDGIKSTEETLGSSGDSAADTSGRTHPRWSGGAKGEAVLSVTHLNKSFPVRKSGWFGVDERRIQAVSDVSLTVGRGECVGLVGESGCGKTTLSKLIMRAMAPDSGSILFRGESGQMTELVGLDEERLKPYRKRIQFVFQDPFSSLNPRMTVQDLISEPMLIHGVGTSAYRRKMVLELMEVVGLDPRFLNRYPHSFSGGQRQRIGIARALCLRPDLLILDEPTSALDVSVQAQILNLLKDLQRDLNLTYLFISHNLAVIDYMADRIAVMCAGRIVESAPRSSLFRNPAHPYTRALLNAVPYADLDHPLDFSKIMDGKCSDPSAWPAPFTVDRQSNPPMVQLAEDHFVRMSRADYQEIAV